MDTKWILASRTVLLNLASLLLLALEQQEVIDLIPQEYMPYALAALAVLNLGLRNSTSQPVRWSRS